MKRYDVHDLHDVEETVDGVYVKYADVKKHLPITTGDSNYHYIVTESGDCWPATEGYVPCVAKDTTWHATICGCAIWRKLNS